VVQNYENDYLKGLVVTNPLNPNLLFLSWKDWQL
jgi:hypothetical protein